MFDFKAREKEELSVSVGETVTVLSHRTDGWSLVRDDSTGLTGEVPTSYIQEMSAGFPTRQSPPKRLVQPPTEHRTANVRIPSHSANVDSVPSTKLLQVPPSSSTTTIHVLSPHEERLSDSLGSTSSTVCSPTLTSAASAVGGTTASRFGFNVASPAHSKMSFHHPLSVETLELECSQLRDYTEKLRRQLDAMLTRYAEIEEEMGVLRTDNDRKAHECQQLRETIVQLERKYEDSRNGEQQRQKELTEQLSRQFDNEKARLIDHIEYLQNRIESVMFVDEREEEEEEEEAIQHQHNRPRHGNSGRRHKSHRDGRSSSRDPDHYQHSENSHFHGTFDPYQYNQKKVTFVSSSSPASRQLLPEKDARVQQALVDPTIKNPPKQERRQHQASSDQSDKNAEAANYGKMKSRLGTGNATFLYATAPSRRPGAIDLRTANEMVQSASTAASSTSPPSASKRPTVSTAQDTQQPTNGGSGRGNGTSPSNGLLRHAKHHDFVTSDPDDSDGSASPVDLVPRLLSSSSSSNNSNGTSNSKSTR